MPDSETRLLVLGAHPDDAEFHAGGLASVYRSLGRPVKLISVTDGSAGHQTMSGHSLAELRRDEARSAGRIIESEYETWNFPDGYLQPTLDVRHRIIKEIREFQPDLLLTHRTNDYHPDHRAVGQAVQDACYLVTVPAVVPQTAALTKDPVVAAMPDLFTRPCRLRADAILDIGRHFETVVSMLHCQRSQVYDWLPYNQGILEQVPGDDAQKVDWLRSWFASILSARRDHFDREVCQAFPNNQDQVQFVECYEISEYAHVPDDETRHRLFPHCRFLTS